MGRFSNLIPTTGRYVNAADKAMLAADPSVEKADERSEDIAGPVALRIIGCRFQGRAAFGPRWLVDTRSLAGDVDICIDFAATSDKAHETPIEARMAMFGELRDNLTAGEAYDPVVLVRIAPAGKKGGNPFWTFRDATPDEIATPVEPVFDDEDEDAEPEPVKVAGPKLRKGTAAK